MPKASTAALPVELYEVLTRIGSKLDQRQSFECELEQALHWLNGLPASVAVRAEREISNAAKLYHSRRSTDLEQLVRLPSVEYLFIFHSDGRIREAALKKITGGLRSPFLFAAIAWRLNDWALPVRIAAVECARRTFPLTAAEVIAQADIVLLPRKNSWTRWTDEEALLAETLGRADVASSSADIIREKQTGGAALALRYALQQSVLDPHLEKLAYEAVQPAVRAVALRSLIDGYASWPSGFEWQWVDKSMGVRRRVRTFDRRRLTRIASRTPMIVRGVADRSAAVRKVALDGLIRYRAEIPEAKEIAEPLLRDRVASVRERAEFLLTVIAEAT